VFFLMRQKAYRGRTSTNFPRQEQAGCDRYVFGTSSSISSPSLLTFIPRVISTTKNLSQIRPNTRHGPGCVRPEVFSQRVGQFDDTHRDDRRNRKFFTEKLYDFHGHLNLQWKVGAFPPRSVLPSYHELVSHLPRSHSYPGYFRFLGVSCVIFHLTY